MDKIYTIECHKCGTVTNNSSPLYCDNCQAPIEKIKFGCFWYDVGELIEDNPFF